MLRVMTYNIQHGIDHMHRLKTNEMVVKLDEVVKIIKSVDPDIVTLNEIYDSAKFGNQTKYIAEKLGYYYYFGKAIFLHGGNYGNALLSKYPLIEPEVIPIPDATLKEEDVYYESRAIIKSCIIKDNTKYNIFSTHFGLAKEEQDNGTTLIKSLVKDLDNVVFMGDLNLTPDDKNFTNISNVLKNTIDVDKNTFKSDNPTSRIDYIFVSNNLSVISGEVLDIVFSDHLPLVVNINDN